MPAKSKTAVDQNQVLLEFLGRRHPDYDCMEAHWQFLEATYEGGRDWFKNNVFRYIKEGDKEFNARLERCYRFNHTREVTDLVQKYIFKSTITRNEDDAPQEIKDFWASATLSDLDITQYMKLVSTASSVQGRPWVFTDSTKTEEVVSVADAKSAKARVYSYIVKAQDVLDIGYSKEGERTWVLIRTWRRDDADPITSSGDIEPYYVLWTPVYSQEFRIITEDGRGKLRVPKVVVYDPKLHNLGQIPGFPVDHVITDKKYSSPALINDIAYLDRAVANYLSNLDAIIQDQTFSQLAIPAQSVMPGTDEYNALIEMGTKRLFTYDGEGGGKPEYLSPDPKQAQIIITVINKIISEIYHTIGMAGERTKSDNAMGIDNSSGVAKAYDFERMNSLLTSKADSLENAENKLNNLVLAWHGKRQLDVELVEYPDTFDVRSLFDEFTVAERLALVAAPDSVRQEQMKQVIDKLFPRLSEDLRKKMEDDLKSWPPALDAMVTTSFGGSSQPAKFPTTGKKTSAPAPSATTKRQGQVTKTTGQ